MIKILSILIPENNDGHCQGTLNVDDQKFCSRGLLLQVIWNGMKSIPVYKDTRNRLTSGKQLLINKVKSLTSATWFVFLWENLRQTPKPSNRNDRILFVQHFALPWRLNTKFLSTATPISVESNEHHAVLTHIFTQTIRVNVAGNNCSPMVGRNT